MKPVNTNNDEIDILKEISEKLDVIILLLSLQGKDESDKIKILKNYPGPLNKRKLQRITGMDRRDF